jgi:hypothetical protein
MMETNATNATNTSTMSRKQLRDLVVKLETDITWYKNELTKHLEELYVMRDLYTKDRNTMQSTMEDLEQHNRELMIVRNMMPPVSCMHCQLLTMEQEYTFLSSLDEFKDLGTEVKEEPM